MTVVKAHENKAACKIFLAISLSGSYKFWKIITERKFIGVLYTYLRYRIPMLMFYLRDRNKVSSLLLHGLQLFSVCSIRRRLCACS
jgi:hypothetical protein